MNISSIALKLRHIVVRHFYVILYLLLSLVILGPALKPGYIFLLDMPWPTTIQLDDYTAAGTQPQFPLYVILAALNVILPAWLLQKLLLVGILTAAGTGVYLLASRLYSTLGNKMSLKFKQLCAAYAGLLAVLNPYVSERLFAGQWHVLSGYAVASFFILCILKWGSGWQTLIMYALLPIISIHYWIMISVCLAVWGAVEFRKLPRGAGRAILRAATLFGLFNAFWIGAIARGHNNLTNNLDVNEFEFFKTASDSTFGVLGNVLSLHGFWLPDTNLKDEYHLWFMYALTLTGLAAYGLYYAHISKKRIFSRKRVALLAGMYVAALVLSIGYAHSLTKAIIQPFTELPLAAVMRETAKAIGLQALLLSIFAPLGIYRIVVNRNYSVRRYISPLAPLVTIIIMSGMLFGLQGRLMAKDYPAGWYSTRDIMPESATALVVPWQGYMKLNFVDNRYAANPAETFFWQHIIQSRSTGNPLLNDSNPRVQEALNDYLDMLITDTNQNKQLLAKALAINLKNTASIQPDYLIILKTGNWQRYEPLIANSHTLYVDNSIALIRIEQQ